MSVGGGIRKVQDIDDLLRSGADKVIVNTSFVKNPKFINEAAKIFGSQCVVVQIDAKVRGENEWEVYIEGAREPTGLSVLDWIKTSIELGAGEIFLTSIDHEGMCSGLDIDLIKNVSTLNLEVPIIYSGGVGNMNHILDAYRNGANDGIAMSHLLHIEKINIDNLKNELSMKGVKLRLDA